MCITDQIENNHALGRLEAREAEIHEQIRVHEALISERQVSEPATYTFI